MADLYSLVHRDAGPLATFTEREDAERELADVLSDEPSWVGDLWVEPFDVVVAEPSNPVGKDRERRRVRSAPVEGGHNG